MYIAAARFAESVVLLALCIYIIYRITCPNEWLKGHMIKTILIVAVFLLCVVGHIYELRHETEEDKRKKMWMFDHGFYGF